MIHCKILRLFFHIITLELGDRYDTGLLRGHWSTLWTNLHRPHFGACSPFTLPFRTFVALFEITIISTDFKNINFITGWHIATPNICPFNTLTRILILPILIFINWYWYICIHIDTDVKCWFFSIGIRRIFMLEYMALMRHKNWWTLFQFRALMLFPYVKRQQHSTC